VSRKRGGSRRIAGAQLAELAGRLTPEDRALCRLLAEHQVLAVDHVAGLLYGSAHTARHRLLALHRLGVVDRFRPLVPLGEGSASYHYVLGEAGAQVLAAEMGVEVHLLGYRRDRALAIAHSPSLPKLLAANGFFAALAAAARRQPDAALLDWWPAGRCAQQWSELVRPDGYGRWRDGQAEADFFVEVDRGSEAPTRLAGKLEGYATLAAVTQVPTPVLFWFPSTQREATARAALAAATAVPLSVATATPGSGGGAHGGADPAGPVWLPIGSAGPRQRLAALATHPRGLQPGPPTATSEPDPHGSGHRLP
jgi:hypothetical protein